MQASETIEPSKLDTAAIDLKIAGGILESSLATGETFAEIAEEPGGRHPEVQYLLAIGKALALFTAGEKVNPEIFFRDMVISHSILAHEYSIIENYPDFMRFSDSKGGQLSLEILPNCAGTQLVLKSLNGKFIAKIRAYFSEFKCFNCTDLPPRQDEHAIRIECASSPATKN